jgi:uncharacterized protein YaaQ
MVMSSRLEAAEEAAKVAQQKQLEAEELATENGFHEALRKDHQRLRDREAVWVQKEMDFKRQLRDRRHVDTGLAKSTTDIERENKRLHQENKQLKEKCNSLESEIEKITGKYSNAHRLVHSLLRFP